jgi:hypothetical protein
MIVHPGYALDSAVELFDAEDMEGHSYSRRYILLKLPIMANTISSSQIR